MKKSGKGLLGILLALGLVQSTMVSVFADQTVDANVQQEAEIATWTNASDTREMTVVTDELELKAEIESDLAEELPDNDELFAGFFEQQLYEIPSGGISTFGNYGEAQLNGLDKIVYEKLKAEIIKIAKGERSDTKIEVTAGELGLDTKSWTAEELGVDTILEFDEVEGKYKVTADANTKLGEAIAVNHKDLMNLLLVNCPYELYWFDKTENVTDIGGDYALAANATSIRLDVDAADAIYTYRLCVANGYQSSDAYHVNSSKVTSAKDAATMAQSIVAEFKNESDYQKLQGYLKKICTLTSYDTATAEGGDSVSFGDPWQVVYVFDGDDNTSVVCEGYAKAFQYLCDLTKFDNTITSYIVTGTMTGVSGGQTSSGPHMWNVITMEDGKNYLVDVTNCDTGAIGNPDKLFIVTTSGDVESGYTFTFDNRNSINYSYYINTVSESKEIYGSSILTLSDSAYTPTYSTFEIIEPTEAIEYGDILNLETKGGADGTITWISSNESVAEVDATTGRVEVKQMGSVTITASEGASANYAGGTDSFTFEVQPKELQVINVEIADKVYDGTVTAHQKTGSVIDLAGKVGSDDVQISVESISYEDKYAGTDKTVTVNAVLTGGSAGNYKLGTITAKADIDPAPLTILCGVPVLKTYNGTTTCNVANIGFEGTVGGDQLAIDVDYSVSASFADANVGYEKPVTAVVTLKNTKLAGCYTLENPEKELQGTIVSAPLMIKVADASMEAGANRPEYKVTAIGLVGNDAITAVQYRDTAGDGMTKGTYQIIPTDVTISGGKDNYEIAYNYGTLTITLQTKPLSDTIARANEVKTGITVSDLEASKVSKGTNFVNTSEMESFEKAIADAEATITSAVKLDEIQTAVTTLEQKITEFKTTVKVGTKKASSGGGGGGGGGSSSGGGGGSSSGGGGSSSSGSSKTPAQTASEVLVDTYGNKSGVWTNDAVGRWFRYSDGTWPAGKWVELSQNGQKHWYYFNTSGYLATGWILDGGIWYYLNPAADAAQGQMSVGWQLINGVWYYLNPVSGQRPLGAMYCNEWTPDGYFVDASGAWR